MNSSFVSVIIPTYNRASVIARAVNSVLNQTYSNLECIVIDDASSDNTEDVIRNITDDRLVYIKHDTNTNASSARNTGLKTANGEYIAFQDSDDEWLTSKLEKQLNLIESLPPEYGMVYCWQDYYDGNNLIHTHHMTNSGMLFPSILTRIMTGGAQTLLFKKEILVKVGLFDERILNGDDQDFIRRVAKHCYISYVPEVLAKVYINHNSETRLSDNKIKKNNFDLILSYNLALEKFKDTFNKRPDLKAYVYSSIAYQYALLNDKKKFFKYNLKAWLLWPFRGRIKSTVRGIKILKSGKIR
jgi:glycosyltransferase involved in cell wall biosynthesis